MIVKTDCGTDGALHSSIPDPQYPHTRTAQSVSPQDCVSVVRLLTGAQTNYPANVPILSLLSIFVTAQLKM